MNGTDPDMGSDVPPALPPLSDAVLDGESVEALFRDLQALVTVESVQLKHGPGHVGEPQSTSLEEAKRLLAAGAVRGVQIRYRFDGAYWLDTLLSVPDGVRLVRIRHTD